MGDGEGYEWCVREGEGRMGSEFRPCPFTRRRLSPRGLGESIPSSSGPLYRRNERVGREGNRNAWGSWMGANDVMGERKGLNGAE